MSLSSVSDAEARSVHGPRKGFCDTSTSTTQEYLDLRAYAGKYIKIVVATVDHWVCFGVNQTFTMDIDALAMVAGDSTVNGDPYPRFAESCAERVKADDLNGIEVVVPPDAPYLSYRTVSATGEIRVYRR